MPFAYTRYRINYRQGGKQYHYFISARTVEHAEAVFDHDTQDEPRPQITEIVSFGEM